MWHRDLICLFRVDGVIARKKKHGKTYGFCSIFIMCSSLQLPAYSYCSRGVAKIEFSAYSCFVGILKKWILTGPDINRKAANCMRGVYKLASGGGFRSNGGTVSKRLSFTKLSRGSPRAVCMIGECEELKLT